MLYCSDPHYSSISITTPHSSTPVQLEAARFLSAPYTPMCVHRVVLSVWTVSRGTRAVNRLNVTPPHVLPPQTAWHRRRKTTSALPGCAAPLDKPLFYRRTQTARAGRTASHPALSPRTLSPLPFEPVLNTSVPPCRFLPR